MLLRPASQMIILAPAPHSPMRMIPGFDQLSLCSQSQNCGMDWPPGVIHVPAGAVPKDGPSAGVALTTALVSLLSGQRARGDVALTGEISLRGKVLPVGGIKDKLLAAHRAGIQTVVLPRRNEKDLHDVPDEIRNQLEIRFVDELGDALALALPQ